MIASIEKMDSKGVLTIAFLAVVGLWYIKRQAQQAAGAAIDSVGESISEAWDVVSFDPASMGPNVELTDNARLSVEDYKARGYMDENGNITPEGDAYIERMRGE